jgi:glycerate 2-kinase
MIATLKILGDLPVRGMLIAPRGQRIPAFNNQIETFLARHPVPDEAGVKASQRLVQAISTLKGDALLICLISGGASSLLAFPAKGVTLKDEITTTQTLLESEATIHEINAVRRHLSRLKGGRLVELCPSSTILSLIISDVPGNHLHDIGSGLTATDPTTYYDAVQVLKRHNLWTRIPHRVQNHLMKGERGLLPETPKPGTLKFRNLHNFIIADNRTACEAARRVLKANGLHSSILTSSAELDARSMGRLLAGIAAESRDHPNASSVPSGVIIGGESTVHLTHNGRGGRNQEVALSAVRGLRGVDGTAIAAMGTDGVDGNSIAAGAIVDGRTALRAKKRKLDPEVFLDRNDSYEFFRRLNDALITGPTGTNVGDIYLLISAAT